MSEEIDHALEDRMGDRRPARFVLGLFSR
jgi:hypothetical protein